MGVLIRRALLFGVDMSGLLIFGNSHNMGTVLKGYTYNTGPHNMGVLTAHLAHRILSMWIFTSVLIIYISVDIHISV